MKYLDSNGLVYFWSKVIDKIESAVASFYTKPTTGIPKKDLESSVQKSLSKADTALQSETYRGTLTGIKMNGASKTPANGIVDLGTVITAHQDISNKVDKVQGKSLVLDTEIKRLSSVKNYDDTEIWSEVNNRASTSDIDGLFVD